jgi:hypothetical protein
MVRGPDPDFAVHSAWLARLVDVDHAAVDNNDAEKGDDDGGSAAAGFSSPGAGDRFGTQTVNSLPHSPPSACGRGLSD